ncbi:hypothetical protein C8R46DRAFT_1201898 [Mycena filopes]|nr:hypothetical protein C8R46DRAFT_1201898 [Mycena filopes]
MLQALHEARRKSASPSFLSRISYPFVFYFIHNVEEFPRRRTRSRQILGKMSTAGLESLALDDLDFGRGSRLREETGRFLDVFLDDWSRFLGYIGPASKGERKQDKGRVELRELQDGEQKSSASSFLTLLSTFLWVRQYTNEVARAARRIHWSIFVTRCPELDSRRWTRTSFSMRRSLARPPSILARLSASKRVSPPSNTNPTRTAMFYYSVLASLDVRWLILWTAFLWPRIRYTPRFESKTLTPIRMRLTRKEDYLAWDSLGASWHWNGWSHSGACANGVFSPSAIAASNAPSCSIVNSGCLAIHATPQGPRSCSGSSAVGTSPYIPDENLMDVRAYASSLQRLKDRKDHELQESEQTPPLVPRGIVEYGNTGHSATRVFALHSI